MSERADQVAYLPPLRQQPQFTESKKSQQIVTHDPLDKHKKTNMGGKRRKEKKWAKKTTRIKDLGRG